ncbi:uncharacterized protein ACA1_062630 [Acanthamoeba castellanii str. Neff]|uniref:PX domain-containing protein n=1 Tax=Acanthamoeba castellanii (strain ATCC 30010 / Neff) TaxID=1257118 RepID=L8GWC4_ACACF|nr:uncharacterized protein ACA1_062630 [Acanthamoeba castellanii str. Neff]ELR17519.1 hypothetical protein ACA1_062630 [Acanthamoeba castellanii str. Neff]
MSVKGLDKWQVSIPTVDTKPDGTSYYNLAVRNDFMSWVAPYRYSALHDFKIKMERRFPHLRLPSFPPKSYTLFGTHGPEFLDDRRHGLETFVQAEKGEQARQQFVSQNQARSLVSPAPSPR